MVLYSAEDCSRSRRSTRPMSERGRLPSQQAQVGNVPTAGPSLHSCGMPGATVGCPQRSQSRVPTDRARLPCLRTWCADSWARRSVMSPSMRSNTASTEEATPVRRYSFQACSSRAWKPSTFPDGESGWVWVGSASAIAELYRVTMEIGTGRRLGKPPIGRRIRTPLTSTLVG